MLIKKLTLHKYKRFFLNNITTLVYTPEANIQVILGSNGSGKSSLFKELSPLPADIKKNYYEDGYKEIVIEHNNNTYVLTSGKPNASKHSFKKDDVELNEGGTRSVQLELVKEHFKITPDLMDILLGLDNFTKLPPTERKNWLSKCSTVDYTYPISVFLKLKTRHRDIQGGIKIIQDEIVKNKSLTKDEEELKKLKRDKKFLEDFIEYLTGLYVHDVQESNFEQYESNLKSVTKKLDNVLSYVDDRISIKEVETNITLLTKDIEYKSKEIDNLKATIREREKLKSIGNKEKLIEDLALLKSSVQTIEPLFTTEDYPQAYRDITSIYSDLVDTFNQIENYNSVRGLTPEEGVTLTEDVMRLDVHQKQREITIDTVKKDIAHMESHLRDDNKTKCPSCSHQFYLNYDENTLQGLKNQLQLLSSVQESESDLKKRKSLELLTEFNTWKNNLKTLLSYQPRLKNAWAYLLAQADLRKDSSSLFITTLDKIVRYLRDQTHQVKIQEGITKIENDLKNIEELEKISQSLGLDDNTDLDRQLTQLVDTKRQLTLELDKTLKQQRCFNELEPLYFDLTRTLASESITNDVKVLRNKSLADLIKYFKSELINVDTSLSEHIVHTAKLDSDIKILEDYKNKEKVLKLMLKELSPSEGLIARSMNSFISLFIKEMNDIINSIWSYSMEILPCELSESSDLDYKFKVLVNDDEIIEDISKLSSSMQEIVNLAFRILLCRYMRLDEIPLYLDEFGSTFDSKHRNTAYQVIDKIVSSDFKQIFMICHYESLYGSLQNTDFSVLNSGNIELNNTVQYNKRLKLT